MEPPGAACVGLSVDSTGTSESDHWRAGKTTSERAARGGRKIRKSSGPARRASTRKAGRSAADSAPRAELARDEDTVGPGKGRRAGRKSRILVVDDHPIFRQGLVKLIEQEPGLEISCEAGDTRQTLEQLSRSEVDLAIVDLSLKGDSGLDLVKKIKARFPRLPVLVLSMHEESLFAERVLHAGGSGYVMKQEPPAKVVTAIRRVLGGDIYVSDKIAEGIVRSFVNGRMPSVASPVALLSDRELEVFQLLGRGLGTRQVAEALYLSVNTIETYRQRIKKKLALRSAAELVHRAIEWAQRQGPPP